MIPIAAETKTSFVVPAPAPASKVLGLRPGRTKARETKAAFLPQFPFGRRKMLGLSSTLSSTRQGICPWLRSSLQSVLIIKHVFSGDGLIRHAVRLN